MKKIIAIVLLAGVLFTMTACKFSSSSSSSFSVTTSVTDEEGNTQTNTTSSEVGVSVGTDGVEVTTDSSSTETTEPAK